MILTLFLMLAWFIAGWLWGAAHQVSKNIDELVSMHTEIALLREEANAALKKYCYKGMLND